MRSAHEQCVMEFKCSEALILNIAYFIDRGWIECSLYKAVFLIILLLRLKIYADLLLSIFISYF